MAECRVRLELRWCLAAIIWVLLCLIIAPAASAGEPDLISIQRAIDSRGLGWTPQAYNRAFALGANLDQADTSPQKAPLTRPRLDALPASLDWRNHGGNWVSPIKDQDECGSCWAFAGVAALESQYALQQNTPGSFLDLSEQILVACAWGNGGCSGGYMDITADFLKTEGTSLETCYPYAAVNGNCASACSGWQATAYKIADYEFVPRDVAAMKEALQGGPFQVSFYVYSDFYSYGSGVYEYAWGVKHGGHAVLLVGYVDTPGQYGGGYFIVKNSWGSGWGEGGYFRIGYSQVVNDISFGKTAYRYYMATIPGDAYEVDDTSLQAKTIMPSARQARSIRPSGDVDWIKFTLLDESDIVVETSGPLGEDTRLWLYDSRLAELAYDDDAGQGYYSRIVTTLGPGAYYLLVDAYNSRNVISSYYLDLTAEVSCSDLVVNGSFEGSEVWQVPASDYSPAYTDARVHSGGRAMRLGITEAAENCYSYSDVQQEVAIPAGASQALLSFWLYSISGDAGDVPQPTPHAYESVRDMGRTAYDVQYVLILDESGRWIDTLVWQCSNPQVWTYYEFDLREYIGQSVQLQFGVYNTGGGGVTAALLDDVSLIACGALEPPAPTPTPTASPTPRPISYSTPIIWRRAYAVRAGGWNTQDTYPRDLADVDGDARADIVGFGARATYVSLSTGSAFAEPSIWIANYGVTAGGWASYNQFPRALGDVNGDGQADVVGFGSRATFVSLSNGSGFAAPEVWIRSYGLSAGGWLNSDLYPRLLGDVNGDGRDDVVGFGRSATFVSLSTGFAFQAPEIWIANYAPLAGGWMNWDSFPRQLADVDGDGRADIVGFGRTATYVSLSKGDHFDLPTPWIASYGSNAGGWSSQNVYYRTLADVNGDGMADIVAFGYTSVQVSLSTGAAFQPSQEVCPSYAVAAGGWTNWNEYPRRMADVNGDGRADIVGFGRNAVYVSLAN